MYDIERYLNVQRAGGASFLPDDRLAFGFDATGTRQIWTLDGPQTWPTQRTVREERVTFVDASPTRPEAVVGSDAGGNERTQLFRLALADDPDDAPLVPLTDRPEAKHRWGGWSHDGERFAFAANRRDRSVFDIYVQGRADDDARLVCESDGWLSVGSWSPDDDRLVVVESHSSFEQDVFVLDVESGDLDRCTPADETVRYRSLQWGPAGDALYCVTDRERDTLSLVRLDPATGAIEPVVDGGDWNVDGIALDDDTGRLVYSRNVDGYTDLTVGELTGPTTIEPFPAPDLPDGTAGGVSFDADAERFAVTASARDHNPNVHVVDIETGESEQWTAAPTAGIPRSSFVAPEVVRFPTHDDRDIPGLLSLPDDPPADGAPVVVDVHGGPESQRRPGFRALAQYFLSHGYAVFEPNIRGSTGYGRAYTELDDKRNRMDAVADVREGVAWLAEHAPVNRDRMVIMGGSYGGFVTLACLTEYPDLWAAGVDVVGIANFVTFLENTGSWRRALREAEYGSLDADRDYLESISPIHDADRISAPLFVIHGVNDPRVPVEEAEQIAAAASEHVPVETMLFDDEGHGISKRENRITAYRAVVDFLDEHV
jgi:dipeptidyl aminopeptidase/acylaminoacyl peptidase